MIRRYSIDDIASSLSALGLSTGDIVLVRADLGKIRGKDRGCFLDALLKVVGPDGTIVGLSFSKAYPFYAIPKSPVFSRESPTNSGAFSSSMLAHADSLRSDHPTNSFVAIGKMATYILENHNASSMSYDPMKRIVECNGKMLVAGCVASSPGFTTAHYAQQALGLTRRSILRNLLGVNYFNSGQIAKYLRKDFGGCSRAFDKFYKHYVRQEILKTGMVGGAYAIMANAIDAYQIEYTLLKREPTFALCFDRSCFACQLLWKYNYIGPFVFTHRFLCEKLKNLSSKLFKRGDII